MHISEMRRREDFDAILAETLAEAWSRERGEEVLVSAVGAGVDGQQWCFMSRHSAFVHRSAGRAVRRFLADSIRYTSRRWRRPAQFLAGTLLSTQGAIALMSTPGFCVSPGIERPESHIVLPGNQRIRVFDLRSQRTRVYKKVGFDGALMEREIALRREPFGPFPPLTAHDETMTWFEEPIVEGWCLARCPASVNPTAAIGDALDGLDAWTQGGAEEVSAAEYVDLLAARVRSGLTSLEERFQHETSPWGPWLEALVERAREGMLCVGPSHGDCQDGNIMVHRNGKGSLIDWEHVSRRWVHYDRMVFALRSRYQAGLPMRLKAYMRGQGLRWHSAASKSRTWREVAIARFLLEDSVFQVEEAARGPYTRVTEGLCDRESGMQSLGPGLEGLWDA